jgi:hypothetical protein
MAQTPVVKERSGVIPAAAAAAAAVWAEIQMPG